MSDFKKERSFSFFFPDTVRAISKRRS